LCGRRFATVAAGIRAVLLGVTRLGQAPGQRGRVDDRLAGALGEIGVMGWMASPTSATRPQVQVLAGHRS
jgi:hypothetical protein